MKIFDSKATPPVHAILLLSMSKLAGGKDLRVRQQTPADCLEFMQGLERRFAGQAIHYTLLYTDGLYANSDQPAVDVAKKVTMQMVRHQEIMRKLLAGDGNQRVVEAVAWDQLVLEDQTGKWESDFEKLMNFYRRDEKFAGCVRADTLAAKRGETPSDADIRFILNELLMFEKIRRLDILPPSMKEQSETTLIVYPGAPLISDRYLIDNNKRAVRNAPTAIDRSRPYQNFRLDVSNLNDVQLHESLSLKPVKINKPPNKTLNKWASLAASVVVAGAGLLAYEYRHAVGPVFVR